MDETQSAIPNKPGVASLTQRESKKLIQQPEKTPSRWTHFLSKGISLFRMFLQKKKRHRCLFCDGDVFIGHHNVTVYGVIASIITSFGSIQAISPVT